jgi:hypothetical protein
VNGFGRGYLVADIDGYAGNQVDVSWVKGTLSEGEGRNQAFYFVTDDDRRGEGGLHVAGEILAHENPGVDDATAADTLAGFDHYSGLRREALRGAAVELSILA